MGKDPIHYEGKTYIIIPINKLGLELYGLLIKYADGTYTLRTFNDKIIAVMALHNLLK